VDLLSGHFDLALLLDSFLLRLQLSQVLFFKMAHLLLHQVFLLLLIAEKFHIVRLQLDL